MNSINNHFSAAKWSINYPINCAGPNGGHLEQTPSSSDQVLHMIFNENLSQSSEKSFEDFNINTVQGQKSHGINILIVPVKSFATLSWFVNIFPMHR